MMKFGVVAYLMTGERCIFTKEMMWILVKNSDLFGYISSAKTFKSYLLAKNWLIQRKELDYGKNIEIVLATGEVITKKVKRIRIELIKREETPGIPSKEAIKKVFEAALQRDVVDAKNYIVWGVHFSSSVKIHEHISLSIRDIKEGFAIHPLKIPYGAIKAKGINAYTGQLYKRVLHTWLLHLITNQTEMLVNYSRYSEKELLDKIYSLYEAIDFEDDELYKELIETYRLEMQHQVSRGVV
ncbi:TPA: hypothetical protein QCQ70_002386 [Bacillus cytotoxicus]|nr:hypothetical protein [Bacillus cytotoxicus]